MMNKLLFRAGEDAELNKFWIIRTDAYLKKRYAYLEKAYAY